MFPDALNNLNKYIFKNYTRDTGKLLVHMGAAGWALSSAAQIMMLAGDKSIDKKKKKFLIPQEFADAGVNILMYYTVCEVLKKGSDKLMEKGKIITDDVADLILKMNPGKTKLTELKDWKKIFTADELKNPISKLLSMPKTLKIAENLKPNQLDTFVKNAEAASKMFKFYKNGVGTFAAIFASVVACNILTPYFRNKLAAKYQKHQIKKENYVIRKEQITNNITMKNPLPTSYKPFNSYNSFAGVKI